MRLATDPGAWGDAGGDDGGGAVEVVVKLLRADTLAPRAAANKAARRVWRFPKARTWSTVEDLKSWLRRLTLVPVARQRLLVKAKPPSAPLLTEVPNHRTLNDVSSRARVTLYLSVAALAADGATPVVLRRLGVPRPSKSLDALVAAAEAGLMLGHAPQLALDGTGGTYFLRDAAGRSVACFKPRDEEPYAALNPRGFVGEPGQTSGLREGVRVGEACQREVAAFILDRGRFAGVPLTVLAECAHPALRYADGAPLRPKTGSLQEFVRHDEVAADLSPSLFSVAQVHKIVVLDIRLLNLDRNDANLLCRYPVDEARDITLVPIDHGYCLPDRLDVAWCDWCWLEWPQIRQPLSPEMRAYVLALDAADDLRRLEERGVFLRPACARTLHITTTLLQTGVRAGLTLRAVADIACRQDLDTPSRLEELVAEAGEEPPPPGSPLSRGPSDGGSGPASAAASWDSASSSGESTSDDDDDDDDAGRFWTRAPTAPFLRRCNSDLGSLSSPSAAGPMPRVHSAADMAPDRLATFLRRLERVLQREIRSG